MKAPTRVLALRFGSVGDLVLTTPALGALKAACPATEVVLATRARWAPVAESNPHVDRVVTLGDDEGLLAFARRLRELDADALLDLHQSLRSRALRWLLPHRPVGVWQRRPWFDDLLVRAGLRRFVPRVRLADRSHHAVEALLGRPVPRGVLAYRVSDAQTAALAAVLTERGVPAGAPVLGIAPGANWATKRWPVERFAALAERAADAGFVPLVTGSAAEAPLAAAITSRVQSARDLTGRVDLALLGAFADRCAAFVANDSGPMHIARARGVPTLALFGSTSAAQFDFTGHRAVHHPTPCAPCHPYGRPSCPRGHFACMEDLRVDAAWGALERLLRVGRVRPVAG